MPAALDAASGVAAGAVFGAVAGPLGAAVGAVLGGLAGAAAGIAVERGEHEKAAHDQELDRVIGVVGGHVGEASPNQPPPRIGAFSAACMGARSHGAESSDGPLQNVDGD